VPLAAITVGETAEKADNDPDSDSDTDSDSDSGQNVPDKKANGIGRDAGMKEGEVRHRFLKRCRRDAQCHLLFWPRSGHMNLARPFKAGFNESKQNPSRQRRLNRTMIELWHIQASLTRRILSHSSIPGLERPG